MADIIVAVQKNGNVRSVAEVGGGLEDVDVVTVVDGGHSHGLEGVQVHLVDLFEVPRVHESFAALVEVPQAGRTAADTPQQFPVFVTPLQLRHLALLLDLYYWFGQISHVPQLDESFCAGSGEQVAVEGGELDGVEGGGVGPHGEDGLEGVAGVPEDGIGVVVAGGEDAVVELVVGDFLDLAVVEVEVGQRSYLVTLLATADVPDRQLPIIAAGQYLPLLVRVPLQRVPLGLMTGQDQRGHHADGLYAFGGSAEAHLVEEVDLPEGGAGGDEVGPAWVVSDAIDLTVMLDLMLNHDLVRHTVVVLADGLRRTKWSVPQLPTQDCLVGQVDLGHHQAVLLLARRVRAVEEVAETVLIVGVSAPLALVDPPLHAEGRPLEFLRVERLVEVGGVPSPHELLRDVVVERALRGCCHYFLHQQAANYQYKLYPPRSLQYGAKRLLQSFV